MKYRRLLRLLEGAIALIALLWFPSAVQASSSPPCPEKKQMHLSFSLDGVSLNLCTVFLPSDSFVSATPDNAIQTATSVSQDGLFKEFSITAVPFGTSPPTEGLPVAQKGSAPVYRKALADFRKSQGGNPQQGPAITLFGQRVEGLASTVNLFIDVQTAKPVFINEWVVEAGDRLWIVRVSRELSAQDRKVQQNETQAFQREIEDSITLSSNNINVPSLSLRYDNEAQSQNVIGEQSVASNLPFPSWWHGDCDTDHYSAHARRPAYPLGATYRGLKACGPRPYRKYENAPDVPVYFFKGAHGEYEWECVELSMRYLYLAYGIPPYPGNGKDVVPNYSGNKLQKINNGTHGKAPQPGDVLSYGPTSKYGHTSVVIASNVDGNGNGSITILEQNAARNGSRDHTVRNWYVKDNQTVSGWLHGSDGSTNPPPTCPSSGGVILYQHWRYDCGGEGEGRGWVRRNGTGWQNVPGSFNDRASSIRVPSGWSVKLFEHSDRHGGWVCRTGNDDNFAGDRFNNGVGLNDSVSSFEVFHDNHCGAQPNRAPNTPSLRSPGDRHVADDGRAPTLCWNNRGDPDGNRVEFYVEVYASAVNASSGWIRNTCWRPSKLDGHYEGYRWRVKAKDSHGAESGWSSTWHFSIEAPNERPRVSFDTANGNNASRIVSRDRDWLFRGSAHDKEGRLRRVEFRCRSCDNKGGGSNSDNLSGRDDNWRITRTGMAGRNDVYFKVWDDKWEVDSRHLDLRIDLAAPATTSSLAGTKGSNDWYKSEVTVKLRAQDQATGRAAAGVSSLHYRIDGGGWQSRNGASMDVRVSANGQHTVEYYARDKVGNQEGVRRVTFKIDKDAPNPPPGINETHGIVSNIWQKDQNKPTFTWQAATDAVSGVWGYQLYFGADPNGKNYQSFRASDPRTWTPKPHGTPTGTYYLRGRTRDNAGNWSAWTTLYTFRYDGTPPDNPGKATHAADIKNDVWQNVTSAADFTWPAAHDDGSGIQGYSLYWGTDPQGTSANLVTGNTFQNPASLCGENSTCTGYLRLRSKDKVGHEAEDWTTAFVLRYDNTPPTVDFIFSSGMTTTQTLVNLLISGQDDGSGVKEMRISSDGQSWTNWEPYAEERPWVIPAISRQSWPVYVQVRDGVGLESPVVMHEIYLDVNAQQPRSASYRLFDYAMSAGAGSHHSAGYQGHSTVGQVFGHPANVTGSASLHYALTSGYEAASQALPLTVPGHDEYTYYNGIFASGIVAETMKSTAFQMRGVVGEPALPNNQTTLNSGSYQHQPGFLAAEPGVISGTPTPTPSPTPTPTPTPAPKCEFPQISINEADLYTNDPHVTLSICAPNAVEMMISNDGGFGTAQWEPYAETKAWTITTYGDYVLPRYVYAAFKNEDGSIHGTYFDDIIYDPNAPVGGISTDESMPDLPLIMASLEAGGPGDKLLTDIGSAPYLREINGVPLAQPMALQSLDDEGAVNIYVNAQDDNSGLTQVEISASPNFTDTAWQPYSALLPFTPDEGDGVKTVYARFQDEAGNISEVAQTSFVLDSMAPFGGVAMWPYILGPDVITSTVNLGADDNLSGVAEMRLSESPDFVDAPWQPYTTTVTWLVDVENKDEGTLYVQYRDLAGNESTVIAHPYQVDKEPPMVYVLAVPDDSLTQTLEIYAYDELSDPDTMRLSNDPLMWEDVVTMPYTDTVTWTFDDREVVWVQVKDAVGNWSEPYPAQAASKAPDSVQSINLNGGWTLISFNRITASTAVTEVMASAQGNYDRILGEDGTYDVNIPPDFNNLRAMEPGKAYWVHTTAPASLNITGAIADPSTPIELHAGWNWVGYLPTVPLSVTDALASITGSYMRVIGDDGTYDVNIPPSFNSLPDMKPGKGYLIYMNQAATLTYPDNATELAVETSESTTRDNDLCPELLPTPYFSEVYGQLDAALAGQILRAYDPRGLVVGCAQVREDGRYGLMRLYGRKEQDEPGVAGLLPGEAVQFALGDQTAPEPGLIWQPDYEVQRLDIPLPPVDMPNKLFLPSIQEAH